MIKPWIEALYVPCKAAESSFVLSSQSKIPAIQLITEVKRVE